MAYFLLYNSSSLPNTAAVSSSVDACCVERYVETLAAMAKASNLQSGAVIGKRMNQMTNQEWNLEKKNIVWREVQIRSQQK